MDPRYRGELLGANRKRSTLQFIIDTAWPTLMGDAPPPTMSDLMEFITLSGMYQTGSTWLGESMLPIHAPPYV